jgi:hypothetical protein
MPVFRSGSGFQVPGATCDWFRSCGPSRIELSRHDHTNLSLFAAIILKRVCMISDRPNFRSVRRVQALPWKMMGEPFLDKGGRRFVFWVSRGTAASIFQHGCHEAGVGSRNGTRRIEPHISEMGQNAKGSSRAFLDRLSPMGGPSRPRSVRRGRATGRQGASSETDCLLAAPAGFALISPLWPRSELRLRESNRPRP